MCSSLNVIQTAGASMTPSQRINGPTATVITMWTMLSGHTDTGHTQLKQNHNSYVTAATYIAGPGFEFQPQVLQPCNHVGHDSTLPDK